MSYDLMVFEPTAAPRERAAFMAWYQAQVEWSEDHTYDDPAVSSPALQRWFDEMIEHFPPLNGPKSDPDLDTPQVTDHCVGRVVIYSAFGWSQAAAAHARMRELAIKHAVGFYDVSGDDGEGEILFPGEPPLPVARKPWWKLW